MKVNLIKNSASYLLRNLFIFKLECQKVDGITPSSQYKFKKKQNSNNEIVELRKVIDYKNCASRVLLSLILNLPRQKYTKSIIAKVRKAMLKCL